MIAVDTNLLVYAFRGDAPEHERAAGLIHDLAQSGAWAIPWPCIHEFLAVVTRPGGVGRLAPELNAAIEQMDAWMQCEPWLLGETAAHWELLTELLQSAKIRGGAVHDARIAALCLENGIDELWTADRDFSRFPGLRTRNPLVAGI